MNEKTFLSRFRKYGSICIQCHDNPDADALASGYALFYYYKKAGVNVHLIYGGQHKITKPNLVWMIRELNIPVEYVTEELPPCDLLITTDCRYGERNVAHFNVEQVAVIDHHECDRDPDDNCCIRSNLVSCSTIVWDLMRREGWNFDDDLSLSTALYYGLYSDSNQFEELFHPLDRDMRDSLKRDDALIFRLINTNLSVNELNIASRALSGQIFVSDDHFSVIESEPCDPNILGIISDFVIQVEEIQTCVAFNRNHGGYKLSVRSCVRETKANELAVYLCEGLGGGGGHINKAGGFISADSFSEAHGDMNMNEYLTGRMREYHKLYEIIEAKNYETDISQMELYRKKPLTVGYVRAVDIFKVDTPVRVRTLEGDVDVTVEDDLYFMIGIEGEVYPIREEKFNRSYEHTDGVPDIETDYLPTVRDNIYGDSYELADYMKPCLATGGTRVYGMKLDHPVKVFTAWDKDKYYRGEIGDYLVAREDDLHDVYVVRGSIFDKTYEMCE
ncbi:MAG: DHH family phosphoesterase [Eubacterium sp.]|nr:DHH family phosphoesterase [Eubacterium sp.]